MEFTFTQGRSDQRILLVIFANSTAKSEKADFACLWNKVHGFSVLWVTHKKLVPSPSATTGVVDGSYHDAIDRVITKARLSIGLSKKQIILAGDLGLGASVIRHSLFKDYESVIAVAPLGNATATNGPLAREADGNSVLKETDEELTGCEFDPTGVSLRNVYLFRGIFDAPRSNQELKLTRNLQELENFNQFITRSSLVSSTEDLAAYNADIILSIVTLFGAGVAPEFGRVVNGGGKTEFQPTEPRISDEHVAQLLTVAVKHERLFVEGYAFHLGVTARDREIKNFLNLKGLHRQKYTFELAHSTLKRLSVDFYRNYYIPYERGGLATKGRKGIDISSLPVGRYEMSVTTVQLNKEHTKEILAQSQHYRWSRSGNFLYCVSGQDGRYWLAKYDLSESFDLGRDVDFEIRLRVDDGKLQLNGHMAMAGVDSGKDAHFYKYRLLLLPEEHNIASELIPLKRKKATCSPDLGDDRYVDYRRTGFELVGCAGDYGISDGHYKVCIVLLAGDRMYRLESSETLRVIHGNFVR